MTEDPRAGWPGFRVVGPFGSCPGEVRPMLNAGHVVSRPGPLADYSEEKQIRVGDAVVGVSEFDPRPRVVTLKTRRT